MLKTKEILKFNKFEKIVLLLATIALLTFFVGYDIFNEIKGF